MFLRLKLRNLICKHRFAIPVGLLNVFVISSICYSTLNLEAIKHEPPCRRFQQPEKRNFITEAHHKVLSPNNNFIHGSFNDKRTSSSHLSENNVELSHLKMEGCPVDWPYEVIRHDSRGMPEAQVCRSRKGNGQWRCAKGWKRLHSDPYCIKVPTPSTTDGFVSSIEDDHEFQTPRQFVSKSFKLLFHQLPGTIVEISPSVLRVLRKNETFDESLHDHYHKFTFLMHPCLRLIKVWEVISNLTVNVSFTSFLNGRLFPWKPLLLLKENRLKTQTEILFDNHNKIWLDQFLVFEHWNESLSELMRMANVDPQSSEFLSTMSSYGQKCPQMYNQETWSKLVNSYALDFCVFQYSTNLNESHIVPPLNLTMQALESRYNICRRRTPNMNTSLFVTSSQSIVNLPNPCIIHTYYQPAYDDPTSLLANENVLSLWKEKWASAGWQTRVLNESDAKRHPDYEYLKEKFWSFPTVNPQRYTTGNLIRHVAMAAVGGGWMSDYDALPLHFPPCTKIPLNGSYTVWSGFIPALVSGHGNEYTRVAHLMADVGIQWRARPNVFIEPSGRVQVSDMTTLSVLVMENLINCSEAIIETSDYLKGGFACNKTKRFLKELCPTNPPEGMLSFPWAVHMSHDFMYTLKKENITLWPGMSWKSQDTDSSASFRQTLLKYIYNIYLEKCDKKFP